MSDSFLDKLSTSGFSENLTKNIKSFWIPALLASTGVGGLSAYLASQKKVDGETPLERRKRLMRAFGLSAALSGLASSAIIGGKSFFESNFNKFTLPFKDSPITSAVSSAIGGSVGFNQAGEHLARRDAKKFIEKTIKDNPSVVDNYYKNIYDQYTDSLNKSSKGSNLLSFDEFKAKLPRYDKNLKDIVYESSKYKSPTEALISNISNEYKPNSLFSIIRGKPSAENPINFGGKVFTGSRVRTIGGLLGAALAPIAVSVGTNIFSNYYR